MKPVRSGKTRDAMTLLELLLAAGLIVLVSGMLFAFYDASLRSRDYGIRRITGCQLARVVAMKIADEIRSANGFIPDIGPGICGDRRVITIQTVTLPDKELLYRRSLKDEPLPAQCDIRQVQYYLAYDPEEAHEYEDGTQAGAPLGLVRREVKTLHQTTQFENRGEAVDLDLLAPEMKYLRFRYFDGVDWVDKWDISKDLEGKMGNSLPQAVEVTVGYAELPPEDQEKFKLEETDPDLTPSLPEPYSPDTCTVMVRLPQADTFFGSRLMRAERRSRRGVGASGSDAAGGGGGSSGF